MALPVIFTPPPHPQHVVEHKLSSYAGQAVSVESHGWDYVLTGNSLLKPSDLRSIIKAAVNPQNAVSDLLVAYRKAGYLLVAVTASTAISKHRHERNRGITGRNGKAADIVPAIKKGAVHVYVIEGRITSEVMPNDIRPYYSGLAGTAGLTVNQITRRAVLAGEFAKRNGKALQQNVKPASQPGGSDFDVTSRVLPGYKQVSGVLQLGNYGSRYLSTYVTGVNLTMFPGDGAKLTANYIGGQPSWTRDSGGSSYRASGFGYSKVTPWGIYGGSLQTTYYRLGKVSAPLYNQGNITLINLTGKQLLFADASSQLWLTEGFHRVSDRIDVYSGYYTLLAQQYNYLSMGVKYSRAYHFGGLPAGFDFDYTYNLGISPRSGTFSIYQENTAPTPRFSYHQFDLTVEQSLPHGFMGQLSLRGQWAYDTLPQDQQWVLGGFGSLSSYHAGLIAGDSGYAARLMLQAPAQELGVMSVSPNVFVEQGGARYRYIKSPWVSALDYGLGLNVSSRFGTSMAMVYALPLDHLGLADKAADAQRAGLYFVLQQQF